MTKLLFQTIFKHDHGTTKDIMKWCAALVKAWPWSRPHLASVCACALVPVTMCGVTLS